MSRPSGLRLLASKNNERGDLFTRLMKDLFFALGYDDLRLDVAKTGREVDLQGRHRYESRRMVAECKAEVKPIGGTALNTFFGVLNRERKKHSPTPVAGYFVSLSGFTGPGIEQEVDTGADCVILLDAAQVIRELEDSRVLVSAAEAMERAGRCAEHVGLKEGALDGAELLGHEHGYLWSVFYAHGKARTHFALVYADGTPLGETVAREVIEADCHARGSLHKLQFLAAPPAAPDRAALAQSAEARYRQWLGEECGFIQLDGLPADTELSASRLKLEKLFVPLDANFLVDSKSRPDSEQPSTADISDPDGPSHKESFSQILRKTSRLALLADPGGGKSTLLKRLAVAYAFPERRAEVADSLPEKDWLPLFLRCRTLRDRAQRPILELLADLSLHASLSSAEVDVFEDVTHTALRAGRAILLVDGLDEISDEGARSAFAQNLRTFLAMFPQATLVVTSRQAGFRLVAGVVASICRRAQLAPLDKSGVLGLCERWHVEIVGDNEKVRSEARELAMGIWNNDRIRPIAQNPLLLTTLLVVKRWIGELPRNRAALYREAVRVLIRTWNVEGYAPLDEEEALAQLSYVACAMLEQGAQQVGHKELLRLLQEARKELEAELQFARISVTEFVERIEYRSSLLMQTGHILEGGELQPVYEFRHLTFQEYLAARGYAEGQYPGRNQEKDLVDLFEPHFKDDRWQRVIPLAANLAGRKAEEVIKRLTHVCESQPVGDWKIRDEPEVSLLRQCLLDEVQVTAATLRPALRQMGSRALYVDAFLGGVFGSLLREECEAAYMEGGQQWDHWASGLASCTFHHKFEGKPYTLITKETAESLLEALRYGDRLEKCRAALLCMLIIVHWKHYFRAKIEIALEAQPLFLSLRAAIAAMLDLASPQIALASAWAFAWMGACRMPPDPPEPDWLLSLYKIWRDADSKEASRFAAWGLSTQPILPRDTFGPGVWGNCNELLQQAAAGKNRTAAFVVAWYRRAPWNDPELAEMIGQLNDQTFEPTAREILHTLGAPGRKVIKAWDERNKEQ